MSGRSLDVLLDQRLIGHLVESAEEMISFHFHATYADLPERPVLGQLFEDQGFEKIYRGKRPGVPPTFFINLIPQPGSKLRTILEKTSGIGPGKDFDLLEFVGRDLPGSIVIRPSENEIAPPDGNGSNGNHSDQPADAEELRFSLGGVQMKLSMLRDGDKLTLPAKGQLGQWIVKFDSPSYPKLPENEYSILEWARKAGFNVPETSLRDPAQFEGIARTFAPEGSKALVIKRYDRSGNTRIHQEDFAQVVGIHPGRMYEFVSYEKLVLLTRKIIDDAEAEEMVRRIVLMIAGGNNDAHLKNWSILYPDGVTARLTPLYDQVATIAWDLSRKLALKLAGVDEPGNLTRSTFRKLAEKAAMDPYRILGVVEETLARLRDAWREIQADLPLPAAHRDALCKHWAHVPLLREAGPLD